MKLGKVYLLVSSDSTGLHELYKIGITTGEISNRIKSLSTGNPNKICCLDFYESNHYLQIEKALHARFRLSKTASENEWFSLTETDIINFKLICKKLESDFTLLKTSTLHDKLYF